MWEKRSQDTSGFDFAVREANQYKDFSQVEALIALTEKAKLPLSVAHDLALLLEDRLKAHTFLKLLSSVKSLYISLHCSVSILNFNDIRNQVSPAQNVEKLDSIVRAYNHEKLKIVAIPPQQAAEIAKINQQEIEKDQDYQRYQAKLLKEQSQTFTASAKPEAIEVEDKMTEQPVALWRTLLVKLWNYKLSSAEPEEAHERALYQAVESGSIEVVKSQLDAAPGETKFIYFKKTLLYAIEAGREDVASEVLSRGVNINVRLENHLTPLATAAQTGNEAMVDFFLNKDAVINRNSLLHPTALATAASACHPNIVTLLLSKGAKNNINSFLNDPNICQEVKQALSDEYQVEASGQIS